ncbi:MAG: MFS transporter [Planctomycetes bacterium]|nr:MFS transporter [Planctomycetota bacterium]
MKAPPSTHSTMLFSGLLIFFAFGSVSSFQYHGVAMEQLMGMSPTAIGNLCTLGALSAMAAPLIASLVASVLPNPNILLSLSLLFLGVLSGVFPYLRNSYAIALVVMSISIAISLTYTTSMTNIQISTRSYGNTFFIILRAIGTLGFALACYFSSRLAVYCALEYVFLFFSLLSGVAFLFSLKNLDVIPLTVSQGSVMRTFNHSFISTLKLFCERTTILLIFFCFISSICSSMGMALLGNFITNELGENNAYVGTAWSVATFMEIPFILSSIFILKYFKLKTLLLIGLIVMTIRMFLTYTCTSPEVFLLIQALHGVYFGTTTVGISIYLKQAYGEDNLHLTQTYSNMIIAGIGAAIAGKINGFIWSDFGLRNIYLVAACFGLVSFLGILLCVRIPNNINSYGEK